MSGDRKPASDKLKESSPYSVYSLMQLASSKTLKLTCLFLIFFALFASMSRNLFFLSWCSISGRTFSTLKSNNCYLATSLSLSNSEICLSSFLGWAITVGAMKGCCWEARPNLTEWEPICRIIVSEPFSDKFRCPSREAESCKPCKSKYCWRLLDC